MVVCTACRYTGIEYVEAADCGCSGYGPFCGAFAPRAQLDMSEQLGHTVTILRIMLQSLAWYQAPFALDHRSACAVCSLRLVNYFLNVLYHQGAGTDVPLDAMLSTSRPQEGFVFPILNRARKADHSLDEPCATNFARRFIKDQVPCIRDGTLG